MEAEDLPAEKDCEHDQDAVKAQNDAGRIGHSPKRQRCVKMVLIADNKDRAANGQRQG